MTPREKIARLLSPLLDVLLRSRTMVKFFLTLGIFLLANHLAYLIRFEFDVPPDSEETTSVIRRAVDAKNHEGVLEVPREERVRRAMAAMGKFRSGIRDLGVNHDKYLAEDYMR